MCEFCVNLSYYLTLQGIILSVSCTSGCSIPAHFSVDDLKTKLHVPRNVNLSIVQRYSIYFYRFRDVSICVLWCASLTMALSSCYNARVIAYIVPGILCVWMSNAVFFNILVQ